VTDKQIKKRHPKSRLFPQVLLIETTLTGWNTQDLRATPAEENSEIQDQIKQWLASKYI